MAVPKIRVNCRPGLGSNIPDRSHDTCDHMGGDTFFNDRKYLLVSLVIVIYSMIPFF